MIRQLRLYGKPLCYKPHNKALNNLKKDYVKRGFTLIEMVTVILIIGILYSLSTIGYSIYMKALFRNEAKVHLLSMHQKLLDIFLVNKTYSPLPDFIENPTFIPSKSQTSSYRYRIELNLDESSGSYVELIAHPINDQVGDGALYLDTFNDKKHYVNDSASGEFSNW